MFSVSFILSLSLFLSVSICLSVSLSTYSTTVPEPLGIGRGSEIQSPLTAISRVSPVDEALSGGADNGP